MPVLYVFIGILVGGILVPLLCILWVVISSCVKWILLKTTGIKIAATVIRLEKNKYSSTINRVILRWQQSESGKIFTYRGMTSHPDLLPPGSSVSLLIVPSHPQWYFPADEYKDVLHPSP